MLGVTRLLVLVALAVVAFGVSPSDRLASRSTEYLATIHHAENLRSRSAQSFIGNLIFNDTLNANGEVTISLCDITHDLFGGAASFSVLNFDESGGISNVVSADLSGSVNLTMQFDGCLVFFFNPCCETVGLRITLNQPVVFTVDGSISVGLSSKLRSDTSVSYNPTALSLQFNGFSTDLGTWALPPILATQISVADEKFCADLALPGVSTAITFCVTLNNLTASYYGINICPGLTIKFGSYTILDLSYASSGGGCLDLSFIPQCSFEDSTVQPTIVQLFKSIDEDSNYLISQVEFQKARALTGTYSTVDQNKAAYSKLDANGDGNVSFVEFQNYTTVQNQTYATSPYVSSSGPAYTPGDIAIAVLVTMAGTALVVAAALVVYAQHKGIVTIGWLSKIVPAQAK